MSEHTRSPGDTGTPQRILRTRDAVAIIVGLVIGAGIFRLPSLVAGNAADPLGFYGYWLAGGVISLIGALCYCELASTYPDAGGDYHFLQRAFGRPVSFLFAWARLAVITTGSIAVLGYTFGDYASNLLKLGPHSAAIWAALAVVGLTIVNLIGTRNSRTAKNVLTVFEVCGVLAVILVGLLWAEPAVAPTVSAAGAGGSAAGAPAGGGGSGSGAGAPAGGRFSTPVWPARAPVAILFVLFTYGGWNDGAYISAELRGRRSIVTALVLSLAIVTLLYLAINVAYVRTLGLAGVAGSSTVAADVLRVGLGDTAAALISLIVAVSALTSINATIIVGGRSNYALGRDWPLFGWLGRWNARGDAPRNALLMQGCAALLLIVAGAFTDKIETMVNYTMPVFWFFFMLVGIGLIVLRVRDPGAERPFRVPGYPVTPLLFIATCAWLLYSSLAYVRNGAWVGFGVLVLGALLLLASGTRRPAGAPAGSR
ncbi:MAG TPA: amino acid permease [Burkholderiaceae bacterium]|nr:amino acid permease [Burkholderiaceae bacterium]